MADKSKIEMKPGGFYRHENGRCISVLGEVDTMKWGKSLVIEETDHTGHGISCVSAAAAELDKSAWVEIGKAEFMEVFHGVRPA